MLDLGSDGNSFEIPLSRWVMRLVLCFRKINLKTWVNDLVMES